MSIRQRLLRLTAPIFLALALVLATASHPREATAGVINTAQVTTYTMNAALSCLSWQLHGICIWMTCATFVCTFDVSTKVSNFLPEATFQVYGKGDDVPWTETETINDAVQGSSDSSWVKTLISVVEGFSLAGIDMEGGMGAEAHTDHHKNNQFRIVDAYGNPAQPAVEALADASFGLICSNDVTPMFPYFISNLDSVAWRWSIPEAFYPQSFGGFVIYNLGSLTNNYGGFYPRTGFMIQADQFKSSVLSAFRSAHVITRGSQPHVYVRLPRKTGAGRWPPPDLQKSGGDSGMWQMLYPDVESSCMNFPYGATVGTSKRDSRTQYVWNFWRRHKCCERRGSSLIFHSG